MHRNLFALVLVAPLCAEAVTADMFRVRSTADLVEICSVPPNDAMHAAAIGFCHGYGVGAFHYYQASVSGPEGKPFVCLPDPPPSRTEALQTFLTWVRENPQYMGEPAVDTLFRWLAGTWPCRK
jgi:Ssp1 endopeptidase immunity protein Rap1a